MSNIYQDAIDKWGYDSQMYKAIEECLELGLALSHLLINREGSQLKVLEEIADVEIMIDQVKLMINSNPKMVAKAFEQTKEEKLKRLRERIDNGSDS